MVLSHYNREMVGRAAIGQRIHLLRAFGRNERKPWKTRRSCHFFRTLLRKAILPRNRTIRHALVDKLLLRGLLTAALLASAATVRSASAQSDPVGYQALLTQFSAAGLKAPGTGVVVEQIEASDVPNSSNDYLPDATQSQFSGVTITDEAHGGVVSSHATGVANVLYGTYGFDTGISQVNVYGAEYWLGYVLKVNGLAPPAASPANQPAVANFSWIDTTDTLAYDNNALRRLDYTIDRDNLVAVVAVNNGAGSAIPGMLAASYNSIAVGASDGQSSTGPVPSGVNGPGRSKPDLVAPQNETSYATPEVSAAAAMLVQVARSNPAYAAANNNPAVIKAVLMAGADKDPLPSWSHAPTQPLDPQYGAGQVNFDRAYQILTAGPQTASATSLCGSSGWSSASLNPGGDSKTYYFQVPGGQPFDLSALLTWQRNVACTISGSLPATFTPSLATIDLDLYHANANFTLGSLVDDSISTVDNVQYVFDRGLAPGEYALQVTRTDALAALGITPWRGNCRPCRTGPPRSAGAGTIPRSGPTAWFPAAPAARRSSTPHRRPASVSRSMPRKPSANSP